MYIKKRDCPPWILLDVGVIAHLGLACGSRMIVSWCVVVPSLKTLMFSFSLSFLHSRCSKEIGKGSVPYVVCFNGLTCGALSEACFAEGQRWQLHGDTTSEGFDQNALYWKYNSVMKKWKCKNYELLYGWQWMRASHSNLTCILVPDLYDMQVHALVQVY